MPRQNPKAAAKAASSKKPPAAKSPPKKRAWTSDYDKGAAGFFAAQVSDAQAKNGGVLVGNEAERVCIGLPLRAFSLQYVHSSDVYPLGRMGMTIGESDSCKTAYLFEQMRWFLNAQDGGAVYELNEARDPADLRTSIVGKDQLDSGRFKLEGPCESLEHWQRNVTAMLHQFENTFKIKGGCAFPVLIGLDSITGTTNERVIKNIDETGCAQLTFGQDANLLNQYAKYLFQRLYKWPIAFVCTNHIKYGTDKYNNKIMRIPGGDELRYVSTYITHFQKEGKDIERRGLSGGRKLRMKLMKSMGDHRSILVEFVWYHENGQQKSIWDWHGATVTMLDECSGDVGKEVKEICSIEDLSAAHRTAKCPTLGIRKATPYGEIGKALMEDAKVLRALQDYFGVKRRRVFEDGVPYVDQIRQAIESDEVEVHNAADIDENVDKGADGAPDEPSEVPIQG